MALTRRIKDYSGEKYSTTVDAANQLSAISKWIDEI